MALRRRGEPWFGMIPPFNGSHTLGVFPSAHGRREASKGARARAVFGVGGLVHAVEEQHAGTVPVKRTPGGRDCMVGPSTRFTIHLAILGRDASVTLLQAERLRYMVAGPRPLSSGLGSFNPDTRLLTRGNLLHS